MLLSWRRFDALLRGQLSPSERVRLPLTWLGWQVVCAALFGASLGVFALTSREIPDPRYLLAGAVKVPLLLVFTSGITIPSLYVFGALRGLRFSAREFAAHLMVAHTVLAAVLGSLAPVIAFFALTTSSYSFMILLIVLVSVIAGALGIGAFVRALNEPPEGRVALAASAPAALPAAPRPALAAPAPTAHPAAGAVGTALAVPAPSLPAPSPSPNPADDLVLEDDGPAPPLDPLQRLLAEDTRPAPAPPRPLARPPGVDQGAWRLLGWWLFLYMFVGTQAGWILRPFVGRPELEFVFLRGKEGGFFGGVWYHFVRFLFGEG